MLVKKCLRKELPEVSGAMEGEYQIESNATVNAKLIQETHQEMLQWTPCSNISIRPQLL
jgi:hypothetical protein